VTKNFDTCFDDCSTRRCYLNIAGNPQCCSRECAAGCVGPNDNQCTVSSTTTVLSQIALILQACENFNNNGTCVTNCPPRQIYNPETESFESNENFKFHSSSFCVESCPSKHTTYCTSNNICTISQVLALNKEHFV